jgi:uncharacterized membrane protein YraQ (UPF0718 family)
MASVYYDLLNRFSGSYTRKILLEALQLLGQLWPYLVVGIILSTLVKTFISKQRMADFFSKRNHTATILLASMIGVASPIGSYIIIPMSAALLGIGVPLSALMALMVSSPLINPNLFVLTAGAMGIEMAILRVMAAFLLGSIAGYTTLWLERIQILFPGGVLKDNQFFSIENFTDTGRERTMGGFLHELYKMARYVSKFFFLAIVLAAAIKIAVNPSLIVRLFDSDNILSIILSTGAGVPFYVCGGAAIPVVQQLADLGMSKGAVLAYFISGPITKISNLVIIYAAFKRIILVHYLAIGILGAVITGFALQPVLINV